MSTTLLCLAALAAGGIFEGEVVGRDGPVAGVVVRAHPKDARPDVACARDGWDRCLCPDQVAGYHAALVKGLPRPAPLAETRTDAQGRFRLEARVERVVLLATGPEGLLARAEAGAGEAATLALVPPNSATLKVQAPPGVDPLVVTLDDSGAIVRAERLPDGSYRFGALPRELQRAQVVHPRLAPTTYYRPFHFMDPSTTLLAQPAGKVTGRVVRDGKPVPGAQVVVGPRGCALRGQTDARGEFTLPGAISPPALQTVRATHGGFAAYGNVAYGASLTLELKPSGQAEVTVRSDAGPLPGLRLDLLWRFGNQSEFVQAVTDAAGRARFEHLQEGKGELQVPRGWVVAGPGDDPGQFALQPGEKKALTVTLARGVRLAGRVVDHLGRSVPGAHLSLQPVEGEGTPGQRRVLGQQGRSTDAGGRFAFDSLAPGRYRVLAKAGGLGEVEAVGSAPGAVEVKLPVQPLLEGVVLDTQGRPVVGARVGAQLGHEHRSVQADGWGRFRLGLSPGVWKVKASSGNAEIEESVTVGEKELPARTLRLPGLSKVQGLLVDPAGRPVAGRVLLLLGQAVRTGQPVDVGMMQMMRHQPHMATEVVVGPDGFFSAEVREVVGAVAWADSGASDELVRLVPGEPPTTIRLAARPVVTGRVVDGEGRPVTRFSVAGTPVEHPQGRFRHMVLSPQFRGLRIDASGRAAADVVLPALAGAKEFDLGDVRLEESFTLAGKVVEAATRRPLQRITLRVRGASGLATSQEDGRFELPNLPARELRVATDATDDWASAEVTVRPRGGPVTLALAPHAHLEVQVRDRRGVLPVPAEIVAEGPPSGEDGKPVRIHRSVDQNGQALFPRAVAGRWTLKVTPEADGKPTEVVVVVRPGKVERVEVKVAAPEEVRPPLPAGKLVAMRPTVQEALARLSEYGEVPPCERRETIEEHADGDHSHRFQPPKQVERLAGKGPELVPYVAHPSRKVAQRAAQLLCAAQGPEAVVALGEAAERFPCEWDVVRAAAALGYRVKRRVSLEECPANRDEHPELFARHVDLRAWALRPGDRLVAELERGAPAAVSQVVDALDSADRADARAAAGAVASLSSPAGFLAALHVARAVAPRGRLSVPEFLAGVGGVVLENLAKRGGVAQGLVQAAAQSGPEDAEVLREILRSGELASAELAEALRTWSRKPAGTPSGIALLDAVATEQDRESWSRETPAISRWQQQRDLAALRTYVADPARHLRDRFRAAEALAQLGDASGLVLWKSAAGLAPAQASERRRLLDELQDRAKGAAADEARRLFEQVWRAIPAR